MMVRDNAKLRPGGRRAVSIMVLAALLLGPVFASRLAATEVRSGVAVRAAFGPDCEQLLIGDIKRARKELLVAIFTLTRKNITEALANAVKRGVTVRLKYDAKCYEWQGMRQAIGYLQHRGVECTPIKFSGEYGKMHHKFAVIDRKWVLTGSFNFTTAATTSNYENLVRIESAPIAEAFAAEFGTIVSR